MQAAFHAARMVAAHDALLSILAEFNQSAEPGHAAASVSARFTGDTLDMPGGLDVTFYDAQGVMLAGEGI